MLWWAWPGRVSAVRGVSACKRPQAEVDRAISWRKRPYGIDIGCAYILTCLTPLRTLPAKRPGLGSRLPKPGRRVRPPDRPKNGLRCVASRTHRRGALTRPARKWVALRRDTHNLVVAGSPNPTGPDRRSPALRGDLRSPRVGFPSLLRYVDLTDSPVRVVLEHDCLPVGLDHVMVAAVGKEVPGQRPTALMDMARVAGRDAR